MGVASRPGGHSFAHRAPESPPRQPRGVGCVLGGPSHAGKWEDHAAWLPVPWAPPWSGEARARAAQTDGDPCRARPPRVLPQVLGDGTGFGANARPLPSSGDTASAPGPELSPCTDSPAAPGCASKNVLRSDFPPARPPAPEPRGARSAALVPHVTCTLPGPPPGRPARFPGEGPSPNPRPQLSGCTCRLVTWLRMLSWGRRGGSVAKRPSPPLRLRFHRS